VTFSHLHLILNHVPTVGSAVALGLLLLAFLRRNEHLKIAGLEVLFLIALLTLPVYVTGVGAQRDLRGRPAVSDTAIREHQDVALAGFTVTEFAGFVAWVALFQYRRMGRASRGLVPAVMVLLVASLAIMGRAANLGGEIRHPEMSAGVGSGVEPASEPGPGPAPAADATAPGTADGSSALSPEEKANDTLRFVAGRISEYLVNSPWAWPAAETVHFLGMSLSLGILLAVNLRILGVMPRVAFADVHRLLPWALLGFGANLVTGMLFFVALPGQYIQNVPFYWKIVLLLIAGANFLYLTVFSKAWSANGLRANLADKAMAVGSIVAWLGVLYAGRMLPYLGNAF
jgi:hypothetical protein